MDYIVDLGLDTPINIYNDKNVIDAEYAAKPHGGSMTPWAILGITIALIIIFIIITVVFLVFFNPPAMHEIVVTNNCNQNINVLFGSIPDTSSTGVSFFPVKILTPGKSHNYYATPGTTIIVQGYRDDDTFLTEEINPFTTVEMALAGEGFSGKHQVSDGNMIITNIQTNTFPIDIYEVSVQGGYNVPISIISTGNNDKDPHDNFSCLGPMWNNTIGSTGSNSCPLSLQSPGTGTNYQVCLNPCTAIGGENFCCTVQGACGTSGGCEQLWQPYEYYNIFSNACPNCTITNCDTANYTCKSKNGLTQYMIKFCP